MTAASATASPMLPTLLAAGGVVTQYHGRSVVRHFGDPAAEYSASASASALFDRSHRARLLVAGRSPGQMLNGILTGTMPVAPRSDGEVTRGVGTYHAVLTPKGKMISDLWAYHVGASETETYLLDVPVAGLPGLLEHFGRFLPPRFASVENLSATTASISVVGPDAARLLTRLALGLRVEPIELEGQGEGEWIAAGTPTVGEASADAVVTSPDHDGAGLHTVIVSCTREVWPPAWTVYGPVDAVRALWTALVADGARPAGSGVWGTLRVEAGRPVFGTDMDDGTLPPEAGIVERAIDHSKGCYTGQEVIVRIRDRGHVNRHLRVLDLGDVPAPAQGAELLAADGSGKVVGHLTSVVESPKAGGVLALGYVRRGVEEALLDGRPVVVPAAG